jgi:hypothetical protein
MVATYWHHDPMASSFEKISKQLAKGWRSPVLRLQGHTYRCMCGKPVFFRNSQCLTCGTPLGFEPIIGDLCAMHWDQAANVWQLVGQKGISSVYRRCVNFNTASGCNWIVSTAEKSDYCISCRLNRTIPNQADADNQGYWCKIENAKRRLVSELLALGLPVKSKVSEDPVHGVMFDFLRSPPGGPRVMTSHGNGLITLNVEEADDSIREKIRNEMHEPYRTLLGHFRHEIGHYYWDRLIAGTGWHERFRAEFGDERADYAAALKASYQQGPPPNWRNRYITSYASVHPWEDWAETWAHYLHLVDSIGTALGFGLKGDHVEIEVEPFTLADVYDPNAPDAVPLLSLLNSWVELITALNELARSLGQPDFYPFVMSRPVVRKLHFIQLVVKEARETGKAKIQK